jgi:WD40 repeat protein
MRLDIDTDLGRAFGSPIWDNETGRVVGIFSHESGVDSIAFMIPTQAIAAAWPDLEVGFAAPERRTKKPRIFICHAHEDADIAMGIYERLRESGPTSRVWPLMVRESARKY